MSFDHTFTLQDADGVEHHYEIRLHPAMEGAALMFDLMGMGIEPITSSISSVLGAASGANKLTMATIRENVDLERLDWSSIGGAVSAAIVRTNTTELMKRLIAHTWRDKRRLAKLPEFDAAFKGNYFELMMLLGKVISVNRFLPLGAISGLVGKSAASSRGTSGEPASGQ